LRRAFGAAMMRTVRKAVAKIWIVALATAALSACGGGENGPRCFSDNSEPFCACFASTDSDQGSGFTDATSCGAGSFSGAPDCCADPAYPSTGSCTCAPLDPASGSSRLPGQLSVSQCADSGHLRTNKP
jgi:hypothetical protein